MNSLFSRHLSRSLSLIVLCGNGAVLAACGSDDGGGGGGGTGNVSTGGTGNVSTGGTTTGGTTTGGTTTGGTTTGGTTTGGTTTGGTGGVTGGTGGGGAGGGSGGTVTYMCATGCAVLTVPLTAPNTQQAINVPIPGAPVDLTGATVTFRVRTVGTGGGIQAAVQNGAPDFKSIGFEGTQFKNVSDLSAAFTDITLNVDTSAALPANAGFNKAMASQYVIQVSAGEMGPYSNPTAVYIDSITVTGAPAAVGAVDFMTGAAPATLSTFMPITGSALTHQGP